MKTHDGIDFDQGLDSNQMKLKEVVFCQLLIKYP